VCVCVVLDVIVSAVLHEDMLKKNGTTDLERERICVDIYICIGIFDIGRGDCVGSGSFFEPSSSGGSAVE
jgi:hypothetical protein